MEHDGDDDIANTPIPQTRSDWALLSQEQKERAYRKKFNVAFDSRFPRKITTAKGALRAFAPYLLAKPYFKRNIPRRGYLAALKGGVCELNRYMELRPELAVLPPCEKKIDDFRFLTLWEFNHINQRAYDDSQFVISGSSCCRRAWDNVKRHCLNDTVLLCRDCHYQVTELEKRAQIIANRIIYGSSYRA